MSVELAYLFLRNTKILFWAYFLRLTNELKKMFLDWIFSELRLVSVRSEY